MRYERHLIAALAAALVSTAVAALAAPLAVVRERGFTVCAHPDALPYSSQDRTLPGFQLEIAGAIAQRLGVPLHVEWIVFTRHARRVGCDATIGSIIPLAPARPDPRRGLRLSQPYVSSGYVLVIPVTSTPIARLEDIKGGRIGVEHSSWPHYVLDSRQIPLSSFGGAFDIMDAVARGEVAGGLVSDAYAGWYVKLNPGAVKISDTYVPEPDLRWNVAVGLRNADGSLVDAVNGALATLIADRTIPSIFARYGISYRPPVEQ